MKILFVDDDPLILKSIKRVTRPVVNGYSVKFVISGKEALGFLKQWNYSNILLVTDINMPEISGVELIKDVRERPGAKNIQILAMSGKETPEIIEEKTGVSDFYFIAKPFDGFVGKFQEVLNIALANE